MSLKTVRVATDEGQRVVGVQIPPTQINRVLRDLGVERSFKSPEEIYDAVLDNKETVELVGGLKLRPILSYIGWDTGPAAALRVKQVASTLDVVSWFLFTTIQILRPLGVIK